VNPTCKWSGVDPGWAVKRGETIFCPGCQRKFKLTLFGLIPTHKIREYDPVLIGVDDLAPAYHTDSEVCFGQNHVFKFEYDHGYFRCVCGRTQVMITRYDS
jgi:hypothetical protein